MISSPPQIFHKTWLWWLPFLALMLAIFLPSLGSSPIVVWQDEVQIVDYGRVMLDPGTDWAVSWSTHEHKPVPPVSYLGCIGAELAYRFTGTVLGSRLFCIAGGFLLGSLVLGLMKEPGRPPVIGLLFAGLIVLDPGLVQSYRAGRLDAMAMAFVLAGALCLKLHARNPDWRWLVAACAVIYFFLMLPILVVFPISLSSAPYMQFPPPGFSWQWYERYLDDPQWIDATWRSLYIGSSTAVLALLLGVPLAFSLVRSRFWGRVLVDRLALAPIIVPTIILSVAVYGVFAKLKLIGAWYGLVLAHTVLALPFVVLVVTAGLRDFDRTLEQAAEGLGASRWRTLARVTLPLLRPSLVSAGLLAFLSSFDEVVVALFLAGPNMTLPKKMFDNIMMEIDPTIAAVSVIQILLVSVVMVLIGRFGRGLKDSAR